MSYQVADSRTQNGEGEARPARLATPAEVGEYLGIPINTLNQWRHRGVGPRYVKVGRHVRYRWSDVEQWLAEQEVI